MQKYKLRNFYVGELCIPQEIGNLFGKKEMTSKQIDTILSKVALESDGAIPIPENLKKDYENKIAYDSFLTIFYRINNELICLHNSKSYKNSKYIKNFIPLEDLLPKVSYDINNKISFKEAFKIFDSLFKKNSIFNKTLFNNTEYSINDFYVGDLKFCDYISKDRERINRNIEKKYMLKNNGAKLSYVLGYSNSDADIFYNYLMFDCLLLKYNKELINLHNNQIYPEIGLKGPIEYPVEGYQNTIPFTEVLYNKNIKYEKLEISIPKALKLYKK